MVVVMEWKGVGRFFLHEVVLWTPPHWSYRCVLQWAKFFYSLTQKWFLYPPVEKRFFFLGLSLHLVPKMTVTMGDGLPWWLPNPWLKAHVNSKKETFSFFHQRGTKTFLAHCTCGSLFSKFFPPTLFSSSRGPGMANGNPGNTTGGGPCPTRPARTAGASRRIPYRGGGSNVWPKPPSHLSVRCPNVAQFPNKCHSKCPEGRK